MTDKQPVWKREEERERGRRRENGSPEGPKALKSSQMYGTTSFVAGLWGMDTMNAFPHKVCFQLSLALAL